VDQWDERSAAIRRVEAITRRNARIGTPQSASSRSSGWVSYTAREGPDEVAGAQDQRDGAPREADLSDDPQEPRRVPRRLRHRRPGELRGEWRSSGGGDDEQPQRQRRQPAPVHGKERDRAGPEANPSTAITSSFTACTTCRTLVSPPGSAPPRRARRPGPPPLPSRPGSTRSAR